MKTRALKALVVAMLAATPFAASAQDRNCEVADLGLQHGQQRYRVNALVADTRMERSGSFLRDWTQFPEDGAVLFVYPEPRSLDFGNNTGMSVDLVAFDPAGNTIGMISYLDASGYSVGPNMATALMLSGGSLRRSGITNQLKLVYWSCMRYVGE